MVHPDWQERVREFNRQHEEELARQEEMRARQMLTPAFIERSRRTASANAVGPAATDPALTATVEALRQDLRRVEAIASKPARLEPAEYKINARRGRDGKIDLNSVTLRRVAKP